VNRAGTVAPALEARTTVEKPVPPASPGLAPPAPPNWVAIAALVLSIGTLLKTFYGDFRTWNSGRGAAFDATYGQPVRLALREFDKSLTTLRAFSLADPRPLQEQQGEVAKLRSDWLNSSYELGRLLEEVDDQCILLEPGWSARFEAHAAQAEHHLIEITEPAITSTDELRSEARRAYEALRVGIAEVRTTLKAEGDSYKGWLGRIPMSVRRWRKR
jgi:hypothetical protein